MEVSAENEQEALLKVQDMYRNEEVFYILMILLIPNLIFLNMVKPLKNSPLHPIIKSDWSLA